MLDRKGFLLEKGLSVNVPEPNASDIHNHSFQGTIEDVLESRGTVMVVDMDGEFFEIEPERLTIAE